MLQPKRTKYRKAHKGRIHGLAKGGTALNFGAYGLKATQPGRISARADRGGAADHHTAHEAWSASCGSGCSPTFRFRRSRAEVRQGKGKGNPEWWAARIKPGRIMFELDGVPRDVAEEAFTLASAKLPINTRFVTRLGEGD